MHKKDNYQANFNADEKKDTMKHKHEDHLRTHEVKKADKEHGAFRPRMNHEYNSDSDTVAHDEDCED